MIIIYNNVNLYKVTPTEKKSIQMEVTCRYGNTRAEVNVRPALPVHKY